MHIYIYMFICSIFGLGGIFVTPLKHQGRTTDSDHCAGEGLRPKERLVLLLTPEEEGEERERKHNTKPFWLKSGTHPPA